VRIGELSERAGVSTRALRHYEELGLLPARRRANGYREYDEQDLRLVGEIRELVELGFALQETRPFLDCLRAGHPSGASCPTPGPCTGASSPRSTAGSPTCRRSGPSSPASSTPPPRAAT
jgi:DNA-binding transcriptional MerR regulator